MLRPCDILAAGGTPCVAAHSLTRALYGAYSGPLYRLVRTPGNQTLDIAVKKVGGHADSAAHTNFCRGGPGVCTVEKIFDQSPQGNHLGIEQGLPFLGPPHTHPRAAVDRGVTFDDSRSEAVLGGDLVYAAYFEGAAAAKGKEGWVGQGYSNRTASGTAVGDEPQTVYAVLDGRVFNGGCCFDYGNGEKTALHHSADWTNGSMEAIYWGCGDLGPPGCPCTSADPSGGAYVLADLEHMRAMMEGALPPTPITPRDFVVAVVRGEAGHLAISAGDAQRQRSLHTIYDGPRPTGYAVMKKEGGIVLGVGGDNSPYGSGVFFEGAMAKGYASDTTQVSVVNIPLHFVREYCSQFDLHNYIIITPLGGGHGKHSGRRVYQKAVG